MNPTPEDYCAMLKQLEGWIEQAQKLRESNQDSGTRRFFGALSHHLKKGLSTLVSESHGFNCMCLQLAKDAKVMEGTT